MDGKTQMRLMEKVMATYLERIALGVTKEVGGREHRFKLDDPLFMSEIYDSVDGRTLKLSVEGFIEKLEILSASCVRSTRILKKHDSKFTKNDENLINFSRRDETTSSIN